MITVSYGVNSANVDPEDVLDVGEVRAQFEDAFKIPSDAAATVNNQRAGESTRLTNGDEVKFVKTTAQKG